MSSASLIEERINDLREYIEEYTWSPNEMTVLINLKTISSKSVEDDKNQKEGHEQDILEKKPDPVEGIHKLFQFLAGCETLEDTKDLRLIEEVTNFMNFFYDEKYFTSIWRYILETKDYTAQPSIFVDRIRLLVTGTKILSNFYLKFSKVGEWKQIPYKLSYEGFLYHLFNSILLACSDYCKIKSCNLPEEISTIFEFFDLTQLKKFYSFLFYLIQFQEEEDANDVKKVGRILLKEHINGVMKELIKTMKLPALLLDCIEIGFQLYSKSNSPSSIPTSSTIVLAENLILSSIQRYLQLIQLEPSAVSPQSLSSITYDVSGFQLFVKKIILNQCLPNELIKKLFDASNLQSTSSFNRMQLLAITASIIEIWGQPFFHNNGNLALFQSYSNLLLILFDHFSQNDFIIPIYLTVSDVNQVEEMAAARGSNLSIEILLINSISAGLECSLPFIRMYTMKVAMKYAAIMKLPLEFDELKDLEKEFGNEDLTKRGVKPDNSSNKNAADANNVKTSNIPLVNEDDEEDEDEIQGYFLSHENDSIMNDVHDNKPKVFYLRNCIELITAPEGTPEIRQGILMALEAIPKIVSNHPYDGPNLSAELLFHLLNLQNQYNIENFDGLKSHSITCLLTEYPIRTIPTVGQAILNEDVALGLRRDSLKYLRETALLIYQRNDPSKKNKEDEDNLMTTSNNGRTIIKRPKKYQQWKKKKRQEQQGINPSSRNHFIELLDLFYLPTMKLLQTFLSVHSPSMEKSTTSVPSSSSSSLSLQVEKVEKFNLISEVLISPSKPSPGSHQSQSPAFKKALIEEISSINDDGKSISPLIQDISSDSQSFEQNKAHKSAQGTKILDETDFMLPYDALLSLSLFLKCSVFHLKYRMYALAAIQIAIEYFRVFAPSSLAIRRGSLCLVCTAIEGFLQTFSLSAATASILESSSRPKGPLDALLNITAHDQQMMMTMAYQQGGELTPANKNEVKMELLTETPILSFIEIILIQAEKEQDLICQQLTISLITIFQDQMINSTASMDENNEDYYGSSSERMDPPVIEENIHQRLEYFFQNGLVWWHNEVSNKESQRLQSLKKIIYDGSKIFWKAKLLLDIYILRHIEHDCIEIFTVHGQTHRESNHLYLSISKLKSYLQLNEVENYLENIKQSKIRTKRSFRLVVEMDSFLKQYFISYVINRLDLLENKIRSLKVFLKPCFHDIVLPNSTILETLLDKPQGMEPSKIPMRRISSMEEIKAALPAMELPESPEQSPTTISSPQADTTNFPFPSPKSIPSPNTARGEAMKGFEMGSKGSANSLQLPAILRKTNSLPPTAAHKRGSFLLAINQATSTEEEQPSLLQFSPGREELENSDDHHKHTFEMLDAPSMTSRQQPMLPGLLSKQASSSHLSELDKYLKKTPAHPPFVRQDSASSSTSLVAKKRQPPLQRQVARRQLLVSVEEQVEKLTDSLQKQLSVVE